METIKLSELFDICYGNSLELNRLDICDLNDSRGINFVSRTSKNNGVSAIVHPIQDITPFDAGLITVAVSGSVLESFLQPKPFYTGYHIMVLSPKRKMSDKEKLYYCLAIRKNQYRYSYGRQANRTLKDLMIPSGVESVFKDIHIATSYSSEPFHSTKIELTSRKWLPFKYAVLFEIKKGKRITNSQMELGETPCIRPIMSNNGVSKFIARKPNHKENTITVNYNAEGVGYAYYQPVPYFALDDVNALYPKFKLNVYIALFLTTLIKRERYRFSYGRKWHLQRMKESIIKLPVTNDGKPDWEFMENYIKSLPYSNSLE